MVPSALRTELTMGPGHEPGGSKNSMSPPHGPENAETGEPPSAAIAGATNAAAETTNAIVVAESRRGERTGIPDVSPSSVQAVIIQHRACGGDAKLMRRAAIDGPGTDISNTEAARKMTAARSLTMRSPM